VTFFVDRSLGRRIVPTRLLEAGFDVVAHDEVFDHRTFDVEWLAVAGDREWIVLSADDRVRYRASEREVLVNHAVRFFVVTNAGLRGEEAAALLVTQADAVERYAARWPGPYVIGLYRDPPHRRALFRPG
jgi:hypothetical protein